MFPRPWNYVTCLILYILDILCVDVFFSIIEAHMLDKLLLNMYSSVNKDLRWPTLISVAQRSAHCRHSTL